MLNYALLYVLTNVRLARSVTDVRQMLAAYIEAMVVTIALVMIVPKWGRVPYWYIKTKARIAVASGESTPSGFVRLEQSVKGLPVVLDLLINNRQARKVDEVVRGDKPFTVVKNYVIHHGPGAPDDVVSYGSERSCLTYVSCNGATHPYKEHHICPTQHALTVGIIPYDKGWRLVIQDTSPLYK